MRPFHRIATASALGILAAISPSLAGAQDAALLLGQGEHTTLIVVHSDTVRARTGAGIIVPRATGWWRIGADAPSPDYPELAARTRPIWVRDSIRRDSAQLAERDSLEKAYAAGAVDTASGRADTVRLAAPDASEADDAVELNGHGEPIGHEACFGHVVWAVPLGRFPVLPDTICAPDADPAGEYSLSFVGPTLLTAYAGITTDYAYNFERATIALSLDSLARHPLMTFESDSAPDERDPAAMIGVRVTDPRWVREAKRCSREYRHDDENYDETATEFDYRGTMIQRTPGRWKYVRYYANTSYVGRGAELDCETSYPVSSSITGPDRLTLPMAAVRRAVPAAVDAFTSPNGTVAVVLGSEDARVFRIEGNRLGRELGRVPLATREVASTTMAQWATGSSVRRWERELAPVLPTILAVRGGKGATVR